MGFSPLGLLVGFAVLAPNLLLLRWPPRGGYPRLHQPVALSWTERAGQALCLVVPAITATGALTPAWAPVVAAAVLGYWGLWARYVLRGRRVALLFGPIAGVPVPMAILPVVAFAAAACWLGNPWIGASAVVLAVGHIPLSVRTARAVGG